MGQEQSDNQQSSNQLKKRFLNKIWAFIVGVGVILAIIANSFKIKESTKESTFETSVTQTVDTTNVNTGDTTQTSTPPQSEQIVPSYVKPPEVVKKGERRNEATGESSGNYKSEKLAWEAAVKDAKEQLKDRGISCDSYEIDNEKSSVHLVKDYGYKAKVVIYTYK